MPRIISLEQEKYLQALCFNEDKILSDLKDFAIARRIPILNEFSAKFYTQLLQISKPKLLLEIGTAIGFSAILAAKNLPDESRIVSIEKSTDNIKLAKENFEKFDLSSKIKLLDGDAKQILPSLDLFFDFIFLDADKQDYLDLLPIIIGKLKISGILFVDNLLWKGEVADDTKSETKRGIEILRKFNIQFMKHKELQSQILTIGDGIGLAMKIRKGFD